MSTFSFLFPFLNSLASDLVIVLRKEFTSVLDFMPYSPRFPDPKEVDFYRITNPLPSKS